MSFLTRIISSTRIILLPTVLAKKFFQKIGTPVDTTGGLQQPFRSMTDPTERIPSFAGCYELNLFN